MKITTRELSVRLWKEGELLVPVEHRDALRSAIAGREATGVICFVDGVAHGICSFGAAAVAPVFYVKDSDLEGEVRRALLSAALERLRLFASPPSRAVRMPGRAPAAQLVSL